jgi:coatomer subunit beta'
MLLFLSTGDRQGLKSLAEKACTPFLLFSRLILTTIIVTNGQNNLAFAIMLQLGDANACVDLLLKTKRAPEAAIFARTYAPSQVPTTVAAWKSDLVAKGRSKIANMIADPSTNPELFEDG